MSQQLDLVDRVRQTVDRHALLRAGETVILGVSGGADSLTMAHVLLGLRDACGVDLHVAHLDHGIRGGESRQDTLYVQSISRDYGLGFTEEYVDVPGLARDRGVALEEAARQARYSFLGRTARSLGSDSVAVAHNADDQVETVLMHILRGSGVAGLRGMRPLSWMDELRLGEPEKGIPACPKSRVRLLRPMLQVPRAEIEAYCLEHGLEPRFDRSNLDQTYCRNRIRRELLPLLETYNPSLRTALTRMADVVAADYDMLRAQLVEIWPTVVRLHSAEAVVFDLEGIRSMPLSLRRSLIREGIHRLRRSLRNINWIHVDAAVRALEQGTTGTEVTLPHGLVLRLGYDEATLCAAEYDASPESSPRIGRPLEIPRHGDILLPGGGWRLSTTMIPRSALPEGWSAERHPWVAYFDASRASAPLVLRPRRGGDWFVPLGLEHRQKVSNAMINLKIPRRIRGTVPLLICGSDIVWIVGYRQDGRYAVRNDTVDVLVVRLESVPSRPAGVP